MQFQQQLNDFKNLVNKGDNTNANNKLVELKKIMIEMDSLPPIALDTPNAEAERSFAREVYELAVLLSVNIGDKAAFERNMTSLRPYYTKNANQQSVYTYTIVGLNLLYLIVENRFADFHCELELLSKDQLNHPAITFCTQLDKHLVVGSYDQVLAAAAHPPIKEYSFFLKSLLETVRINIGDCASASYVTLTLESATKVLMFNKKEETLAFITQYYPTWTIEKDIIYLSGTKQTKSEEIPSMKLISQNLSYATELERIV